MTFLHNLITAFCIYRDLECLFYSFTANLQANLHSSHNEHCFPDTLVVALVLDKCARIGCAMRIQQSRKIKSKRLRLGQIQIREQLQYVNTCSILCHVSSLRDQGPKSIVCFNAKIWLPGT